MQQEVLVVKKRGQDENKVISIRIKESLLAEIDKVANEANYSRNELINMILSHGIQNIIVEEMD